MKKRRFDEGGSTSFSPEQEEWLGKADRTDPYILARMRRAVPDRPNRAPVEDRQFTPVQQSKPSSSVDADIADMKRSAISAETPDIADMKRSAVSAAPSSDVASMKRDASSSQPKPVAKPVAKPSTKYSGSGGSGGGRGPTASELQGGSGGGRGPSAEELAAYQASKKPKKLTDLMPSDENIQKGMEAAIPGGVGLKAVAGLAKSLANRGTGSTGRALAEKGVDEAIYLGKTAPRNITPAERLAGPTSRGSAEISSASRPALSAPPLRLTSREAEAAKEAAKKAELAGELRRGQKPTKFDSPKKSTSSKRTRKFNDDEAGVEFKRGGSTSKFAKGGMAKGWGQARGARSAKIV
jgi:hypothetical protein